MATVVRWVGFIALGALALLGRPAVASERLSLWAEDGGIFLAQPRTIGIVGSFVKPYAGYYDLIPRSIGAIAAALPISWTPVIFLAGAITCASACAMIAWNSGRALGLSSRAAMLLGAWVLVLPAGDYEIVNTITNVQWYILTAAIVFFAAWVGGYQPRIAPACILLAVATLTSPLLAVLLPLVALVTIVRRHRLDLALLWVLIVTSAVQEGARIATGQEGGLGSVNLAQIERIYVVRVVGGALVGSRLLHDYYNVLTTAGATAVALGLLLVFIVSCRRADPTRRGVCLLLMAESILLIAAIIVLKGRDFAHVPNVGFVGNSPVPEAGRYMAAPAVCFLLAGLLCLDSGPPRVRAMQPGVDLILAALAVLLVVNFPIELYRSPSSAWTAQLKEARKVCQARGHEGVIELVNAPGGPWKAVLTCRQAFG